MNADRGIMSELICPLCEMNDVLTSSDGGLECVTCGHEWEKDAPASEGGLVVKDAYGTVLADGDTITLIKDLKLKGGSQVLKGGSKAKGIRLVEGDHEISCKIDGMALALKACFVKKG